MTAKLVLLGGGGHCRSVIASLDRTLYDEIIIVDRKDHIGKVIDGIPVSASDDDLNDLFLSGFTFAFITLGSVSAQNRREFLFNRVKAIGFSFPVIIDSSAVVDTTAELAEGCFVAKGVLVNTHVKVGTCAILNTGAVIDHESQIGNFCHIAPGVVMSGNVTIGDYSHIGTGCSIKQGVCVGKNTTIGVGSVVVSDIEADTVAYGVPCKSRR